MTVTLRNRQHRTPGLQLLACWLGVAASFAAVPPQWIWRSQPITGNELASIAGGGDTVVAVGRLGTIVRGSTTGLWAPVEVDVPSHFDYGSYRLSRVRFHYGQFVALGDLGIVLSSADGWNWTQEPTPNLTFGSDLCVDGPGWIALGTEDLVATFLDTILFRQGDGSWTKHSPSAISGMRKLAFGQDKWLAVGGDQWSTSTDGTNWTRSASSLPATASSIAFAEGLWMAVDSLNFPSSQVSTWIMTSQEGEVWEQVATVPHGGLSEIRHLNGHWILIGLNWIATSTDGVDWTVHEGQGGYDLTFVDGYYYLAGSGGSLLRSAHFTDWEELNPQIAPTSADSSGLRALIHANGQWVGTGGANLDVIVSNNGVHWQGLDLVPIDRSFEGLAYGDGRWVATEGRNLWQSIDGGGWTMTTPSGIQHDLRRLAYGNGRWVATSVGAVIYYSDSLSEWSPVPHETGTATLFFADGRFMGLGIQSVDGENWEPLPDPDKQPFAFANGYWFASDDQGEFFRSGDLENWSPMTTPWQFPPRQLLYFDDTWLAFGGGTTSPSQLFVSDDGLTWTRDRSPIFAQATFAAAGADSIVIAAQANQRLQVVQSIIQSVASRHLTDIQFFNSHLQVALGGDAGSDVILEGVSAFGGAAVWEKLGTIPVSPVRRPVIVPIPTSTDDNAWFLRALPASPP